MRLVPPSATPYLRPQPVHHESANHSSLDLAALVQRVQQAQQAQRAHQGEAEEEEEGEGDLELIRAHVLPEMVTVDVQVCSMRG